MPKPGQSDLLCGHTRQPKKWTRTGTLKPSERHSPWDACLLVLLSGDVINLQHIQYNTAVGCIQSLEQKMLAATHTKMALEQDQRQLRGRLAELTAQCYRHVSAAGSTAFRPSSSSPTSSESTGSSYSPSPSDYGQLTSSIASSNY